MSDRIGPPFNCQALDCDRPADYALIEGETVTLALCKLHGGDDDDVPGWVTIRPEHRR